MTTYYKATRPDGTDFRTGTVDYAAALRGGTVVEHPAFDRKGDASGYLSVSVSAADCTGFTWPCRLFVVEPVGRAFRVGGDLPNKRAVRALRVVEERPAWEAFGPNGEAVVAVIDRARSLTGAEIESLAARHLDRYAALNAAWGAAWNAAWGAARHAAWGAARYAAWYAALGELTRDLITPEQYDTLTAPWRSVVGVNG